MLWVKVGAVGVAVAALMGLWWVDRTQQYDAGYTKAELKCTQASQESLETSLSDKLDSLGVTIGESTKHSQTANERTTELYELLDNMQVTLDDIDKWKNVDVEAECRMLGLDFLRLFNEPVQEGRSYLERGED